MVRIFFLEIHFFALSLQREKKMYIVIYKRYIAGWSSGSSLGS